MQQLTGSLIVALAIVAITIAIVTAKLGPNAEQDDDSGRGGDRQEQQDNRGKGSDDDG